MDAGYNEPWLYCDSATFTGCRRRSPLLQTSARQVLVSQWTLRLGHKLYLSFIISIKYNFMWRGRVHCPPRTLLTKLSL